MEDLTIGTRIAELRKKAGYTQNELAEKLIVSNKAVSKWESNNGSPSLEMLINLHKILNCSLDYLILGEEYGKPLNGKLVVNLGKDFENNHYQVDLCKLIHCFIGGEVGSGKSILLHNIITQLITNYTSQEVKLALIDWKEVEFYHYNNVPHLFQTIAHSPQDIQLLFQNLMQTLEGRFDLLVQCGCQNIQKFNEKHPESKLPYIVVIIDELIEVIANKDNHVTEAIKRLTQLGRAAGIHVIASTYKIEMDLLTNINFSNFPTKIAFKMKDYYQYSLCLESQNIKEVSKLGEMMISQQGLSEIKHIQCPYISTEDIKDKLKHKNIKPGNL